MDMELSKALEQLAKLQLTMHAYNHAQGAVYLDSATVAPRGTAEARSQTMGILSEKSYQLATCPETCELIHELMSQHDELSAEQNRQVELLKEGLDKLTRIPMEEFVEYSKLTNEAESVWYTAKEKSDYAMFRPYLEKLVNFNRRFAGYKNPDLPPYDALLDEYEKGITQTMLDHFFSALRDQLVPLLMEVKDLPIDDTFLKGCFSEAAQRELSGELMRLLALDPMHSAIHTSEHPFTIGFSKYDVRITTHYYEEAVASSLYSVMHECGHALYDMGVADEYQYTVLADGASMGIHESQSRFYENIIGRNAGFAAYVLPLIQRLFPGQMSGVTERDFYRAINRIKPSLIRIEADELTYSLHIMVRYELEKALIAGTLHTKDLPETWNRMYKEYLGVTVPTDAQGVLQDTHWAGGAFGYFPSYALGSAYAAQFAHTMHKDLDIVTLSREGRLAPITSWLRKRIHRHGMLFKPMVLLEKACGEPFDAQYYITYMEQKMKDVYGL